MKKKYNIFISYNDSGLPHVEMLESLLKNDYVQIFKRKENEEEMSEEEFKNYAKDAFAFVFFLTEDFEETDFIKNQMLYAVKNQITIIPLMFENFRLSNAMSLYLNNVQRKEEGGENGEEIVALAAERLQTLIENDRTEQYSLIRFLAGILWGNFKNGINSFVKKRLLNKEKLSGYMTSGRISFAIQAAASFLVFFYIHAGISSSNALNQYEKNIISLPPLLLGLIFSFITSLLVRKMKNKILVSIISVLLCVLIFVIMLLTGFFISTQNSKFN